MDTATYFPRLQPHTLSRPPHDDLTLLAAGTTVLLWVLLHAAFAFCWLTAGQL